MIKRTVIFLSTAMLCLWATHSYASGLFYDDFSGTDLDSRWTVVKPNASSIVSLTGSGYLRMYARGNSDYSPSTNYNAPRLYQSIDADLNWEFETKINIVSFPTDYTGISIVLYNTGDAYDYYRFLEYRNWHSGSDKEIYFGSSNVVDYSSSTLYLKLRKENTTYSAWYSSNGTNWISLGTREFPHDVLGVGIMNVSQDWNSDGSYSDFRVDYFAPTSFGTVPEPMSIILLAISVLGLYKRIF